MTLDPASDVAVNIGGDVEAEVPAGLYIIAARVAVNGEEGDCRSTSGSIIYGEKRVHTSENESCTLNDRTCQKCNDYNYHLFGAPKAPLYCFQI